MATIGSSCPDCSWEIVTFRFLSECVSGKREIGTSSSTARHLVLQLTNVNLVCKDTA